MSDKQPEALRLADVVETLCVENTRQPAKAGSLAAAELRRQHAELIAKDTAIAELVEVLRFYAAKAFDGYGNPLGAKARDAIAKATGAAS